MATYLRNNQVVSWLGLEPATRRSQVQRPNHNTNEPLKLLATTIFLSNYALAAHVCLEMGQDPLLAKLSSSNSIIMSPFRKNKIFILYITNIGYILHSNFRHCLLVQMILEESASSLYSDCPKEILYFWDLLRLSQINSNTLYVVN